MKYQILNQPKYFFFHMEKWTKLKWDFYNVPILVYLNQFSKDGFFFFTKDFVTHKQKNTSTLYHPELGQGCVGSTCNPDTGFPRPILDTYL